MLAYFHPDFRTPRFGTESPMAFLLRLSFGLMALTLVPAAHAFGPADYVFTPDVTYGEHEIDFKAGSWKKADEPHERAWSIGYGYGVTQYWWTEFYRKYESVSGESLSKFEAWEWENKFRLTEQGKYPVDVGLVVEVERPQDHSEGYEALVGALFQKDIGKVQLNGNILFQRHIRTDTTQTTQLGYQWQAKYRWKREFEYGLQGFGEVGTWNHWDPSDERTHRLGPAVFGKLPLGGRQALVYNAAWLLGVTSGAPKNTFRIQLEYEF
jgi:hypothetical protein